MNGAVLFKHLWIAFIAETCANGVLWWFRARKDIAANPEREAGYRRLIAGWLFFGNLPWIVMGAGIVVGGVPSVFHFFNPRNGPWAVAWFVTIAVLYALTFAWLFLWNGAEQLAQHPAVLQPSARPQSPAAIRMTLVLFLARDRGDGGDDLRRHPDGFAPVSDEHAISIGL
jgi:hypothetical protein